LRSLARSLLALLITAAALTPGAAVFVRPAYACTLLMPERASSFVLQSELIVIGRVGEASDSRLVFEPEAFLKGPATGEPLVFRKQENDLCTTQNFRVGDRALVYIFDARELNWPYINQVYVLRDGRATIGDRSESEIGVVEEIRAITGQYAVPAIADGGEGAGIDWWSTVLPIGVVLLIVFGIGLMMMRVWHRIDPS
jgi:hypothetical protein